MCENNITNRRTPLRNSNSANKPFRSPLTTVITPKNNESPNNPLWQSPILKTTTPKRSLSQFRHPIKRRRIDNALSNDSLDEDSKQDVTRSDFLALKRRIRVKRQELENLKTKSNYMKKHKIKDLLAQIEKWRAACKEALYQFHRHRRKKFGTFVHATSSSHARYSRGYGQIHVGRMRPDLAQKNMFFFYKRRMVKIVDIFPLYYLH